ncbi:MAG: hypothetical protein HOK71_16320, partial [Planctomycetaceae bacterium]|nr:hypothetical protein [Planctomycetaceae bacterium]
MVAAIVLPAGLAWALEFQLGETKEQLKLKYDVSVADHGTGRVTVVLTIADEGRLKPLNSVDLVISSKEQIKNGGTGRPDFVLSMATREVNGKQVARVHLIKDLAERAEFQLKTSQFDGKLIMVYHVIPISDHFKKAAQKAAAKK